MIPRRVLTIFARIVNFFWRWFRWGVVLGVILLAGVIITAHLRLNQEVRTQIERQLADLCEPLTVSVRSAEVVAGEGIRVHDLVIRDDRPTASHGELLRCDTVMLSCRTDWQTLLCEKPCIKRVVLKRPTLRIVRNPEGDWNLTSLLNQRRADPPTMTELPTIELDGGTIVMFDPSLGPDRRFTLREVHVTLGAPPDPSAPTSGSQPPPRPHIENITAAQTPSPWHANKLCAVTPGGSAAATPGSANAIFNQISPNGGSDDVSIPAEGSLVPEEAMAASSPTLQELRGSFLGDFLGRVSFQGVVRSDGSGGRISGSIERLELLPEARDSLPLPLSHELAALNYVRGEASLEFQVQYTPDDPKPLRFEIAGALRRGHIDDLQLALSEQQKTTDPSSHGHTAPEKPQAPLPVTDLKADFRLTDTGFELTNISARSGPATLSGSFVRHGYHPGDPARLTASIGHLQFDKRLFDLLPASLQDEWKRFDPTGRISGEIIATSDGTRWDSQLSARLDDLSFCFCDFPYRFERGTAAVTLRERRLELNVVAHAGSCPVTMEGDMILGPGAALEPANAGVSMTAGSEDAEKPKDQWIGYFTARGRGMAVDDQLRAAMPEASRDALESLGAEGRFDFQWTVWKKMPDQHPEEYMVLDANDCTVRFEHFAYPITGIFGRIEKRNKYWTFRDLRGVNDSAKITCSGTFTPTTTGDGVLSIELGATDLALDDELRVAMPLGMRQMWNTLAPQGEVDATVSVMCEFGNKQPPKITARIVPDEQVSAIQPKPFPYRMERLGGVILYRDGHVTINSLSATHGNVRLSAMATADVSPDGAWQLRLDNLAVDRLIFDRDLYSATPEKIRKSIAALDPEGPINIRGVLEFSGGSEKDSPVDSRWDVVLDLQQNSMDCGVPMDNLFGEVHFLGVFSNEQLQARAELDLDSATYKSLQLTQINGPIWIEDSQVLIGGWAPPGRLLDVGLRDATLASGTPSPAGQSAGPRRLTAHVVGGIAEVDMRIVLDNTPTYRIRASLSQARLDKCAQEMAAGRQNLKGKVFAAVDLNGTGRSTGTLHGSGELHLREGDVYELPVMISLLKILSIREPDRSGFSSGDVRFHIQGRHISLTDISFRGDAISLLGRGEMDFDHNINLLLHAVVGRGQLNIPVIREIYRGASEQILGIRVGGTLQKPEIRGEPFPVARELIESLREEMDQRQAQTDLRRSQTGRTQPPYARNPNFRTR